MFLLDTCVFQIPPMDVSLSINLFFLPNSIKWNFLWICLEKGGREQTANTENISKLVVGSPFMISGTNSHPGCFTAVVLLVCQCEHRTSASCWRWIMGWVWTARSVVTSSYLSALQKTTTTTTDNQATSLIRAAKCKQWRQEAPGIQPADSSSCLSSLLPWRHIRTQSGHLRDEDVSWTFQRAKVTTN